MTHEVVKHCEVTLLPVEQSKPPQSIHELYRYGKVRHEHEKYDFLVTWQDDVLIIQDGEPMT